jgi:hypothetical protein
MASNKSPPTLFCPNCSAEIRLFLDNRGRVKSEDIYTMRIMTPVYIKAGVIKETKIEVHVCSKCNTILSSGSKM